MKEKDDAPGSKAALAKDLSSGHLLLAAKREGLQSQGRGQGAQGKSRGPLLAVVVLQQAWQGGAGALPLPRQARWS